MKKDRKYIGVSVVALLMSVICLLGGALPTRAQNSPAEMLNYGITGAGSNRTLTASLLFEEFFGSAPTAEEKAYLDGLSGFSFVYNSAVPNSIVSTEYDSEAGLLLLSLPSYVYTATNGTRVEWIPTSVKVENEERSLTYADGAYTCRFEGMVHSGDFEVEIDFTWRAEVPAEAVDAILTAPYTAGKETLPLIEAYEAELAEYNAQMERYLAYTAYLQSVEDYDRYINISLPAYEQEKLDYAPYEKYLEKLAAYEEWQHYWDYQKFMSGDMQLKYREYLAYLEELEPIQARLNILDSLFVQDSRGWQLYASLMGGTVDTVLLRKNELIAYNKNFKSRIEDADAATKELRKLMQTYAGLRQAQYASEHEKLNTLYEFYKTNYKNLGTQFSKLYESLNYLGSDSAVQIVLDENGKLIHYYQFVGQLYIAQACLDDAEIMNKNAPICGMVLLSQAVQPIQMTADFLTDPTHAQMPATEVPRVEKIEPIDPPTVEEVKRRPTLAEFGLSEVPKTPVAPAIVPKPTDNPPPVAEKPADVPTAPQIDARLRALAEGVRQGTLPKRAVTGKSHTMTFETTVLCPVAIDNRKTVTFYSADGTTVLDRQSVEYGTKFTYRGPSTERAPDARANYEFLGWVTLPDHAPAEMIAYGNMSLYANYRETPRFYTITWKLDGMERQTQLKYGATPVSPFATVRPTDKAYTYTFSGWDKELSPVTEDVTYTASFIRTLRTYEITWVVGDKEETQALPYGTVPQFSGSTDRAPDAYRYEFLKWDRPPVAVTENATYVAEYIKTPLAVGEDGNVVSVTHGETALTVRIENGRIDVSEAAAFARASGKDLSIEAKDFVLTIRHADLGYLIDSFCRQVGFIARESEHGIDYTIGYFNSSGRPVDVAILAHLQMKENIFGEQIEGYIESDGAFVIMENGEAELVGAVEVRVPSVFALDISSKDNVSFNLDDFPRSFASGSTVDLSLITCDFGYEISAATLVLSDGSRVAIEGLSFTMPHEAASVEITIEKIIYHVIFRVDGNIIHEADYGLFEKIQAPEDPTKAADGENTYAFFGWSQKVDLAFGDSREIVFNAIFTPTPLNMLEGEQGLFRQALIIAIVVFVIVVAATVVLIIVLRRRKRKKQSALTKRSIAVKKEKLRQPKVLKPSHPIVARVTEKAPVTDTEADAAELNAQEAPEDLQEAEHEESLIEEEPTEAPIETEANEANEANEEKESEEPSSLN